MIEITDDAMRQMMTTTRGYTLVLVEDRAEPRLGRPRCDHVGARRRNFALRHDGVLNVVCPVMDDS